MLEQIKARHEWNEELVDVDFSDVTPKDWMLTVREQHADIATLLAEVERLTGLLLASDGFNAWQESERLKARVEQLEQALKDISEESGDWGARDCAKDALAAAGGEA